MSTFTTIPLEEIHRFLEYYEIPIPSDSTEAYFSAWEYITDHPNLYLPSIYLEDFILAYNRQEELTESQGISAILMETNENLTDLAHSLGLLQVDKERIIRILGYLNLLEDDLTIFETLPTEALLNIWMRLDCSDLGLLCRISKKFNYRFCSGDKLTEILRTKLQSITGLDLSHYTRKELESMCRPHKRSRLAAGYRHSLVIDHQDQVWGFGDNKDGQLGLGEVGSASAPTLIEALEDEEIISVSAGNDHSLFLTSRGQVFSCGANDRFQLGIGLRGRSKIPILINDPAIGKIVSVAAGNGFSLFLNSLGQVFSCGFGDEGQLGLGEDNKYKDVPTKLAISNIVSIAAGSSHSLLLNSQGQVFSFGLSFEGALGLGNVGVRSPQFTPALIKNSKMGTIISISAGGSHSLLLNAQGQVYSFGNFGDGQLGLGKKQSFSQRKPKKISYLGTKKIIAVSAGFSHSLFLDSQGQVSISGKGVYTPTLIKNFENREMTDISAGGIFSLLRNQHGQVFSFGRNDQGQLGLGDTGDKESPNLVGDF
jgi:alpha-tubulin suppressor-like RCC1 family protein